MAGLHWHLTFNIQPGNDPETLCSFTAPAQQRVLIHGVDLAPLGATAAVRALLFEWHTNSNTGSSSDGAALRLKTHPQASETIQTTARYDFTAEPTGPAPGTLIDQFSLHPQSSRIWRPIHGPLVIPGGATFGLRCAGTTTVTVTGIVYLEE